MIVRAKLVRIALLSTALGALTGCDTVGGAVSSVGSSVNDFFSHQDPSVASLNAGAIPRQVAGQPATNPSEKPKVLPVASQDINCPEVDYRRRRRGAARRRPGQRLGALSVQHRRHGARMRSRRSLASRAQDWRQGRSGYRAGRLGRDLQRAAEDHGDARQRQDGRLFADLSRSRRRRTASPPAPFAS